MNNARYLTGKQCTLVHYLAEDCETSWSCFTVRWYNTDRRTLTKPINYICINMYAHTTKTFPLPFWQFCVVFASSIATSCQNADFFSSYSVSTNYRLELIEPCARDIFIVWLREIEERREGELRVRRGEENMAQT